LKNLKKCPDTPVNLYVQNSSVLLYSGSSSWVGALCWWEACRGPVCVSVGHLRSGSSKMISETWSLQWKSCMDVRFCEIRIGDRAPNEVNVKMVIKLYIASKPTIETWFFNRMADSINNHDRKTVVYDAHFCKFSQSDMLCWISLHCCCRFRIDSVADTKTLETCTKNQKTGNYLQQYHAYHRPIITASACQRRLTSIR